MNGSATFGNTATIYGNSAGAGVPPNLVSSAENARDAVSSLAARISAMADRLVGGVPEAAGSGQLNTVRSGIFGDVETAASLIQGMVARAQEQLDRIDRALPSA